MALKSFCIFQRGVSPVVAAAIHDGHDTRPEFDEHFAISEVDRLREEDPFTGEWTQVADTQIVVLRSRFECDLNRPRDKAIYKSPADAWDLDVWSRSVTEEMEQTALQEYDDFYSDVRVLLDQLIKRHGHLAIYDLHSYNLRHDIENDVSANSSRNPDVNVGTGTMDRQFWAPVVDRFINDLRSFDFEGRHLDVRENVKFFGGHFVQWLHRNFPEKACGLAIEFKKFFMNERSGAAQPEVVEDIFNALQATVPGVEHELRRL